MTVADDIRDDYQHWDNTQTVTIVFKRKAGNTTVEVSHAKQADVSRQRGQFNQLSVEGTQTVWHIPDALLSGNVPRQGDVIKEDAEADVDEDTKVWAIQNVQLVRFESEWICTCNLQV